jgi:hypothetical protein
MDSQDEPFPDLIVTATLTSGVSCVVHGLRGAENLVEEILVMEHGEWETILLAGDAEYFQSSAGPYPDAQMRVSVRPSLGVAALNYSDNSDPVMALANSYNPKPHFPEIYLIFSGSTGAVFPYSAAISIADARYALQEWLVIRKRPTCIEWRPYDKY